MIKTAIVSLLIHIIALYFIKIPQPKLDSKKKETTTKITIKQKKSKGKGSEKKEEEIYVIQDLIKMLQKQVEGEDFVKTLMSNQKKDCTSSYIGIGIRYSERFDEILDIVSGGPADRVGFKVGDTFISDSNIRDRYPEGTRITVTIMRRGIIMDMPVTVKKICTKKGK